MTPILKPVAVTLLVLLAARATADNFHVIRPVSRAAAAAVPTPTRTIRLGGGTLYILSSGNAAALYHTRTNEEGRTMKMKRVCTCETA